MNLKLSITTLISSAYFLTLFIYNMMKKPDILRNLGQSIVYSFILFIFLYTLIVYIEFAFKDLRKKESRDAINKIRELELENLASKQKNIQNKIAAIDKEILDKEKENFNQKLSDFNSMEDLNDTQKSDIKDNKDDEISEMKKATGTQFDSDFNANNISI